MAKNFGIVGANEYKGMTLEDAQKVAEQNGFVTRIVEVDGNSLMLTMELRNNRINFRVKKGIVIEAYPG